MSTSQKRGGSKEQLWRRMVKRWQQSGLSSGGSGDPNVLNAFRHH